MSNFKNQVPEADHDVVIDKPVLLSGETNRLASVTIVQGGKLVFDPTATPKAKLTSGNVLIEDGGGLWIGSSDCKFQGKAEVLLTGNILPISSQRKPIQINLKLERIFQAQRMMMVMCMLTLDKSSLVLMKEGPLRFMARIKSHGLCYPKLWFHIP